MIKDELVDVVVKNQSDWEHIINISYLVPSDCDLRESAIKLAPQWEGSYATLVEVCKLLIEDK